MKRDRGLTGCMYVVLFLIFGSGIIMVASAVAGVEIPYITQFWVGAGLVVLGIHLSSEFERDRDND